ncbi:MAG: tRNA (adenosine(37)-N6)-threonylcarbamoyltransferase complex dimerization subunit type 1 TsaB [Bacteroidales bacterium]|nr:tRNA (adenosine(37)-N6)-threonylcarbamoyltransferase complex dimerization subunit type 1 TsaB [Bacteroidales bacterium]MCL2133241.1 tRNA (adenosine(37)-N6)-threonylcarbamoyltransferase complex dimerization subunit type 1 TsaB [Bacteroidales bacterium]
MKNQPLILHIETGTAVCSVALSRGENLLSLRENTEGMLHAKLLAVFIEEILCEQDINIHQLDAISVSEGPGSYTGLRVGVSTAKGLCFGAHKPLIAVGSLQSLAMLAITRGLLPSPEACIIPMIDARRMEVYTAQFNHKGEQLSAIEAKIIDGFGFAELLEKQQTLFIGDGAEKCKAVITHPQAHFIPLQASAVGMIQPTLKAFAQQQFADTAYFEPFYLKDFVVKPRQTL